MTTKTVKKKSFVAGELRLLLADNGAKTAKDLEYMLKSCYGLGIRIYKTNHFVWYAVLNNHEWTINDEHIMNRLMHIQKLLASWEYTPKSYS